MRVFLTGASGFIGSAIVQELIGAGHKVLGLARSEESARSLIDSGAEVHRGSLEDLESLKSAVAKTDGVIHTAFIHDFSNMAAAGEIDRIAIETFGAALEGSGKPLVVTSGIAMLKPGQRGTEADDDDNSGGAGHRIASNKAVMAISRRGVRASLVRLPPSVHGEGDHGFVPFLISIAQQKGVSAYIGEGSNHWPAVHRFDAANLFRLALEKGVAGARYHGVADEGVPTKTIAEAIGRGLNLPVVSKSAEEAAEHFGWIARFWGIDCPASSSQTQQQLGWKPIHVSLTSDLGGKHYFGG